MRSHTLTAHTTMARHTLPRLQPSPPRSASYQQGDCHMHPSLKRPASLCEISIARHLHFFYAPRDPAYPTHRERSSLRAHQTLRLHYAPGERTVVFDNCTTPASLFSSRLASFIPPCCRALLRTGRAEFPPTHSPTTAAAQLYPSTTAHRAAGTPSVIAQGFLLEGSSQ